MSTRARSTLARSTLAALTALALLAGACGAPRATGPDPADAAEIVASGVERAEPDTTGAEVSALTAAQTAFALDLYHAVRDQVDGDLVVGPTSLHTVLAMIRAGARGGTATEMDAVLHAAGLDLHAAGNALDAALRDRNDAAGIELVTANRVWVQHGLELTPGFVDTIAGHYGAGLAAADFVADPEAARAAINGWVADATRDRIPELFPDDTLDRTTVMVLANAVALDADWHFPFDPERTSDEPFTLEDGTEVAVPTMHYDEYLPTAIGDGWTAVELPYDGEQLSMVVIVPQDLASFEATLDPSVLADILGGIEDGGIHLSIPRFTARTHLSLDETLAGMGMPSAFGAEADFSGMTGDRDLWIQAVEHEAVVEVDEEGTEAAAASGGAMQGSHGPTVAVDRPFLFLIRDEPTGAVLFLGRVTDPR